MTYYEKLSTGEKRSLTSSLKKASDLFTDHIQGDLFAFRTKEEYLNAFYDFWAAYSVKQKLSWCKEADYLGTTEFREEMTTRMEDVMAFEIKVFDRMSTSPRPMRSKKKRLRKKREKELARLS